MNEFDPNPTPKAPPREASEAIDWTDLPTLFRELGPIAILAVAWTTVPALALAVIVASLGPLSEWMRAADGAGVAAFVGFFALGAGLGLSPTHALALLGGWTFGFGRGAAFVLAGVAAGAAVGFAFSRAVGGARLEALLARDRRALAVREALVGRGPLRTAGIVALLRCSPSSPFAVSNLAFGTSRTAFLPYLAGTVVGMAPRTLLVVSAGAAGASSGARDLIGLVKEGPGWPLLVGGIVLLIVSLAVVGQLAQKALGELDLAGAPR